LASDSKASGKACSSDVDSKMPTDRLTMRSTIFDKKLKERKAAAEILITPPMVVASKIEDRVVSIFSPVEFNKRRD
jgi:hypothetical protein